MYKRKKSLLSIRDDTRMSYMIQDVTCDNFNFYGKKLSNEHCKKKLSSLSFFFSSHRHIKSDMLKSITREFFKFYIHIFFLFFFAVVFFERKFAKETILR